MPATGAMAFPRELILLRDRMTERRPHADADAARAAAHARARIEELFALHSTEIHSYLARMVRDPELAADLAQDTFVRAYRSLDSLEDPERARPWLYRIAHRLALDEIRRRRILRFLPWAGEAHGTAPSAEHLAMDARLSGPLERALARIPERQRAALLLAELHDLTGTELAEVLGVSHVAARALLTRARESLRQALAIEEVSAPVETVAEPTPEPQVVKIPGGAEKRGSRE